MFHIHVDATKMNSEFERDLVERLNFYKVNYSIDRKEVDLAEGEPEHEYHLTLKLDSSRVFKDTCNDIFGIIVAKKTIDSGYVECEFVALDDRPSHSPYKEVDVPFKLSMRSPRAGAFRESELHVTLSRDESDPRLIKHIHHDIGMLSGFIPKDWGVAQIFTAQGTQSQINQIRDPLVNYIHSAGGAARCSIKEERTVRYWMSHADGIGLPYVIDQIHLAKA